MPSSGMLCHVALVRTDVSEEHQFLQEPHGVTSQKTAFFIITVLRIKNPREYILESHACTSINKKRK
jgi:hypothetical protein